MILREMNGRMDGRKVITDGYVTGFQNVRLLVSSNSIIIFMKEMRIKSIHMVKYLKSSILVEVFINSKIKYIVAIVLRLMEMRLHNIISNLISMIKNPF